MPQTFYTSEEYNKLSNEMSLFGSVLHRVDEVLGSGLVTDKDIDDKDKFHLIPLSNRDFTDDLELIKKDYKGRKTLTFLDAGCGIGIKVIIAHYLGFNAYGIELNDKYLSIAKLLLTTHIKKCDILKYEKYSEYDIIYYYSPFKNGELERRFEELVEDTAKVGAYIISHNKSSRRIYKDKRFKKIDKESKYYCHIWKKIKK